MPADALTWDVESKTWVPVAAGTEAVSKVTFDYSKYLGSNWHHGQPITMADAVYSIAQAFDRAYDPEKAAHRDGPGGHRPTRTSRPSRATA